MSRIHVIDPASVLPQPAAIDVLDDDAMVAAWKAQFGSLWPAYNTGVLEFDTAPIIAEATTMLRLLDRQHINDVYKALRLACATGSDLVGLAADRGVTRRTLVPASGTTPAVLEDYDSLRYRTWLEMQHWSRGSSCLGLTGTAARLAMPDASDIRVYDFPGTGRIRCALLPRPGLSADAQAAMVARVSAGLMRRDVRPGTSIVDTVLAEVLTIDLGVVLGVLPGASRSDAAAASEAAIRDYMKSRRQIGARVATSRLDRAATVTNVDYAHYSGLAGDLVPTRDQAYQLGTLTVETEVARG